MRIELRYAFRAALALRWVAALLVVSVSLMLDIAMAQSPPAKSAEDLIQQVKRITAASAITNGLADLRANRMTLPLQVLDDGIKLASDAEVLRMAGVTQHKEATLGMLHMQMGKTIEMLSKGHSVRELEISARSIQGLDLRVAIMSETELRRHALSVYRKAETHLRREHDQDLWADLQFRLGYAIRNWSDLPTDQANVEAVAKYEAALQVYARDPSSILYGDTANNLGTALIDAGQPNKAENVERAIELLNEALITRNLEKSPFRYADSHMNLSGAYRARVRGDHRKNFNEAIQHWRAAIDIYTERAAPREHMQLLRQIGRAFLQEGDWVQAQDNLVRAADLSDRFIAGGFARDFESVLSDSRGLYDGAAYAAAQLGNGRDAAIFLERGRARMLRATLGLQTLNLSDAERRRLQTLRDAVSEMAAPPRDGPKRVEFEQLRFDASMLYRKGVASSSNPSLAFGVHVVMPMFFDVGSLGLAIDPQGNVRVHAPPHWQTSEPARRVLSAARQWRLRFGAPSADNFRDGAEEAMEQSRFSWGRYLGELIEASGARRGDRVVVVLDPLLATLPIAVGAAPGSMIPLSQQYDLSVTPSLAALRASQITASNGVLRRLAITRPPSDLRSAPVEVASVGSTFIGPHVALDATLSRRLSDADVWHFVTHGTYNFSKPLDSALLLADGGKVTLGQISARAYSYTPPRLVVLSACQSGVASTDGELSEFQGFPMAFLQMRAGAVIASSWNIGDMATTLVMSEFYRILSDGEGAPVTALRLAEAWLRDLTVDQASERMRQEIRRAELSPSQERAAIAQLEEWELSDSDVDRGFTLAESTRVNTHRPFSSPYFWGAFQLYGW